MKNNSQNNRYKFFSFSNASGLGKTLLVFMWLLLTFQALQQFCQIVFSANDSEEMPQATKPYLPFIMALICVLQSTFIFSRKELQKNIKKLDNVIKANNALHIKPMLAINEPVESDNNQTSLSTLPIIETSLIEDKPSLTWPKKIYLGGSIATKILSIFAKAPVTYLLNLFEVKILLTDPILLNWPANSLQVQVIKHVTAALDTVYDLGTENAATIDSVIKTISPHYSANVARKCHCSRCSCATVFAEGFALLGASGHSAKEAFTFCLFLVSYGWPLRLATSVAATTFLAMAIQNYAFQGREFVKYVTRFIDYVIGSPSNLKQGYIEIKDLSKPLSAKQKALLVLLNLIIGSLVSAPSAISHFLLAKLTLKEGAEAFWKSWFNEEPSAYYKELITKLSNIGVADAITDTGTESVETHLKTTKQVINHLQAADESANEEEANIFSHALLLRK